MTPALTWFAAVTALIVALTALVGAVVGGMKALAALRKLDQKADALDQKADAQVAAIDEVHKIVNSRTDNMTADIAQLGDVVRSLGGTVPPTAAATAAALVEEQT